MAIVRDSSGKALAVAAVVWGDAQPLFALRRIDCPENLFAYYFLRGQRAVRVEIDDLQFAGCLVTRWQDNHRLWAVALAAHNGGPRCTSTNEPAELRSTGHQSKREAEALSPTPGLR
jgi:hypothetical protein